MKLIAGIDEVGRGPLAGPVVAATVIFKEGYKNAAIQDSKKLSAKKREQLVLEIKNACVSWSIVAVGHERINQLNIREATKVAMQLSLQRASKEHKPDLVLIDGNMLINTELSQQCVVKGDALHVEISAASILAKVYRDQLMQVLDKKYPGYDFSKHAGYPTAAHRAAICQHSPCRVHRRTFGGVKEHWQTTSLA